MSLTLSQLKAAQDVHTTAGSTTLKYVCETLQIKENYTLASPSWKEDYPIQVAEINLPDLKQHPLSLSSSAAEHCSLCFSNYDHLLITTQVWALWDEEALNTHKHTRSGTCYWGSPALMTMEAMMNSSHTCSNASWWRCVYPSAGSWINTSHSAQHVGKWYRSISLSTAHRLISAYISGKCSPVFLELAGRVILLLLY